MFIRENKSKMKWAALEILAKTTDNNQRPVTATHSSSAGETHFPSNVDSVIQFVSDNGILVIIISAISKQKMLFSSAKTKAIQHGVLRIYKSLKSLIQFIEIGLIVSDWLNLISDRSMAS